MSILRAIGYIGIALLAIIAVLGLVIAFANRDWHGLILMVGFFGLLVFFAYGLRSAAQRESVPALKASSDLGLYGEPLSALFRGPILHSPEGLIMLLASVVSILFSIMSFFLPSWIGIPAKYSAENSAMFAIWPVLLFVIYVRFSGPTFKSSIYSIVVVLCAAGLPFYMAYK